MCYIDLFTLIHTNSIKNVIIDKYKVKKTYQEGWFRVKESITEEQCYSAKIFMTDGVISRKEVIDNTNAYYKKTRDSYIYEGGNLFKRNSIIIYHSTQEEYREDEIFEYIKIGEKYYIEKSKILKNGVLNKEAEYKYNDKGDSTEYLSIRYLSDGRYIDNKFHSKIDYEYDRLKLTKTMIYLFTSSYDNKTKKKTIVYKYDTVKHFDKDFPIELQEYDSDNNLVYLEHVTYDEYDRDVFAERNGRIREKKYNAQGELVYRKWNTHYSYEPYDQTEKVIVSTYEYKYDSLGNWIECRYYEDGMYKMLFIRKIEYNG